MTIPKDGESWEEHMSVYAPPIFPAAPGSPFDVEVPQPEPNYSPVNLGGKTFALCRRCSAIVVNPYRHDNFHRSIPTQPCV